MNDIVVPSASRLLKLAPVVRSALVERRCRIVVTGAGGWFGAATLEMLDGVFGEDMAERVTALASQKRTHTLRSGRHVQIERLDSLASLPRSQGEIHVAHYAFLTREKVASAGFEDYITTNRHLTRFIGEQCRRLGVSGTFSTSSGAVYERHGGLATDLQSNPYGVLKLEEEACFAGVRNDLGSPAALCRVFNVSGSFLNKEYALGSLIRAVLAGEEIGIRATHRVVRSYTHIADIVSIGFAAMLGIAHSVDPYDTAGTEAVEVGELAERVRGVLGRADLPIRRPPAAGEADVYVGNATTFQRLATEAGIDPMPLDQQIADTASWLMTA